MSMPEAISRRKVIQAGLAAAATVVVWPAPVPARAAQGTAMVVYKSPSCGCCAKWVEHMRQAGFDLTVNDMPNVGEVKAAHHVPADAQSCHTALVGGYVIEGHVPAEDVKRLLRERPRITGLTIPGMPPSAPGMDLKPTRPYAVLALDPKGNTTVFAKH